MILKFSYMNLYSPKSSVHYHPDYIHVIWCPNVPQKNITWNEFCNKDVIYDTKWKEYLSEINAINNVRIIYEDMVKFLNVSEEMSEIHKSDLFRYKILNKYGGIWSDLDIVYIKPITDVINFNFDTINFLCTAYNETCICQKWGLNRKKFSTPKNKCAVCLYMPIGLMFFKKKFIFFLIFLNNLF